MYEVGEKEPHRLYGWSVLTADLLDKALHLTNERSCFPPLCFAWGCSSNFD